MGKNRMKNYVTFRDDVLLVPHVNIYNAGYLIDAEDRNTGIKGEIE